MSDSGYEYPRKRDRSPKMLLLMLGRREFWTKTLNWVVWLALGLSAVGLTSGFLFGRSSNADGIAGTASRIGKSFNPFVSNEQNALKDFTGSNQKKETEESSGVKVRKQ